MLALLPARWRKTIPISGFVQWEPAATISGILEMGAALTALGYWYLHLMTSVVSAGMELAVNGKLDVTEQQVGGTALILFLANPLTWVMIYFFFEGSVRTCGAAFTESVLGTVPLYLLERSLSFVRNPAAAISPEGIKRNLESLTETLRERFLMARLREVPDELRYTGNAVAQMLEILASRRRAAWVIPQIVRVDGSYYRLEEVSLETGIRPFRYRLKRLEAGVTGRTVILYRSGDGITTRD